MADLDLSGTEDITFYQVDKPLAVQDHFQQSETGNHFELKPQVRRKGIEPGQEPLRPLKGDMEHHHNLTMEIAPYITGLFSKYYKATAPTFKDEFPKSAEDIIDRIEYNGITPEMAEKGWEHVHSWNPEMVADNVLVKGDEVHFHFQGIGQNQDTKQVFRILGGLGKQASEQPEIVNQTEWVREAMREIPEDMKVVFNGHSYGAWKARYFQALVEKEFGRVTESHLFNAHIMPWSRFTKTTGKINFHTTVDDPLNFKYSLPRIPGNNENHFIYPPNKVQERGFMSSHYMDQFNFMELKKENVMRGIKGLGMVLGAVGLGLTTANYARNHNYNDLSTGLNNFTGESLIGINLDPEQGLNKNSVGFDYWIKKGLDKTLVPTLMSKERKKQNKLLKQDQINKQRANNARAYFKATDNQGVTKEGKYFYIDGVRYTRDKTVHQGF